MNQDAVLGVVLLVVASVVRAQFNCTPTIKQSDGRWYQYNLKPLWHRPGEMDIFFAFDSKKDLYYANFCGITSHPCSSSASVLGIASSGLV